MHKREKMLNKLIEEHGRATECTIILSNPPERYALMESDEGGGNNGGPWWNVGDDPAKLVENSLGQEYPGDWPAELLVDLDTGETLEWEVKVVISSESTS